MVSSARAEAKEATISDGRRGGACSGLFTVTCENLEAFTEETGDKDGEACVAALLGFVIDSYPQASRKVRICG